MVFLSVGKSLDKQGTMEHSTVFSELLLNIPCNFIISSQS